MSQPAIVVENLGKRYKRGVQRAPYKTFREAVMTAVTAPYRRFRSLRGQYTGNEWFWALKDVSFEVQPGEVVGVIGRNGAGKSTLLKVLSRITDPTTGEIRIRGRVGSLLEVGTGFHPELTGRENVYLNGAILGMKKVEIDRKFDEIVAFAEVEKFLDTPVKHYSSGMHVRLGFAVAAHLEPEILIVDEVLAVGDAAFQQKCLGKMKDVAGGGRTVLFVSHNMGAVMRLCTHALLFIAGRIASVGTAGSIVNEYLSLFQSGPNAYHIKYPHTPEKPMQLVSAALRPPANSHFKLSDRLVIDIEVETRVPLDGAYVTADVLDSTDTVVYWTADIGSPRFRKPERGFCHLTCTCPPRLLTPGRYSAVFGIVNLGRGFGTVDHTREARLAFDVVDDESLLSVHGIRYPGITAIQSEWSVRSAETETEKDTTRPRESC